ncbi:MULTISPECIES: hypothetical protein [Pseudoalteromonas]|uniref:Lipoprotein n=1 Tax=Pseudoalteromonas aurantia 208 TaxID=1314867 RepID=A0ABR9EHR2_9GAMM|nr:MULTISPECIES: hypothetical protein [Pseudoalteromonas]MBE0370479.1 hypothetical protein [Pseudoalteromonas aurantia 208]MBQ4845093.1 hypothetical protein [Pseudoalteromonas sp. MMG005]
MKALKLYIPILSSLLVACSSEDIETANFGSDTYKNDYNYVNATQYEVAFHMANTELDGDERDVSNDKYHVATLARDSTPARIRHEHNTNRRISFYAKSVNKLGMLRQEKLKVNNKQNYHVIAWQDDAEKIQIKLLEKQKQNKADFFAIRILSNETLTITINDQAINTNKGEVTSWYYVDDCNSDIIINEKPLDLCAISLDQSYTLVMNNKDIEEIILEE